jgi:hypothetical protein
MEGRYIAYQKEDCQLAVFDIKTLQEFKSIQIPLNDENDMVESIVVISNENLALFIKSSIYVIDWKKGALISTIDLLVEEIANYELNKILHLEGDMLLLCGPEYSAMLDIGTKLISGVVKEREMFVYLTKFNKYLLRIKDYFGLRKVGLLKVEDYICISLNGVLTVRYPINDVLFNSK